MKNAMPAGRQEKLLSIIGISIMVLFAISIIIFVYNVSTEVKIQRVEHLKLIRGNTNGLNTAGLNNRLQGFINETGGLILTVELSYDRTTLTVDLSERWNSVEDSDKDATIQRFGRGLANIFKGAGAKSLQRIKFYDQFSSNSLDYNL